MTSNDKFKQSIDDVVNIIYDLTGAMEEQSNFEKIEEDMATLDKLTTILKRMCDTALVGEYPNIIEGKSDK